MLLVLKDFIYLFLEQGERREKERERNIDVRGRHGSVASSTHPNWGPNPQPRHAPWSGIEPATFHFAGWRPTNWARLVRASLQVVDNIQSLHYLWLRVIGEFKYSQLSVICMFCLVFDATQKCLMCVSVLLFLPLPLSPHSGRGRCFKL